MPKISIECILNVSQCLINHYTKDSILSVREMSNTPSETHSCEMKLQTPPRI